MPKSERNDVIKRLTVHLDRIQGLMDLIANKPHLSPEEKGEAQERMRILKEGLKTDHRDGSLARNATDANACERAYLFPAVHQALTAFRSRWDSNPIHSNWISELYEARIEIQFSLRNLENAEPE